MTRTLILYINHPEGQEAMLNDDIRDAVLAAVEDALEEQDPDTVFDVAWEFEDEG